MLLPYIQSDGLPGAILFLKHKISCVKDGETKAMRA